MNEHAQHDQHQAAADHSQHNHTKHSDHNTHDANAGHGGHGGHAGHEIMFRNRFWVSLILSIPVLIFSPALQSWLGYTAPQFMGSMWITPSFQSSSLFTVDSPSYRWQLMSYGSANRG